MLKTGWKWWCCESKSDDLVGMMLLVTKYEAEKSRAFRSGYATLNDVKTVKTMYDVDNSREVVML